MSADGFDPAAVLARVAGAEGRDIDLCDAALALSVLENPGHGVDAARAHIRLLAQSAAAVLEGGSGRRDAVRLAQACQAALAGAFGYGGDHDTYDALENADLVQVIARRRGLPVALGILYIETGRRLGGRAHGLNVPGHFLVAFHGPEGAVVCDPFHGGRLLAESDIGALLPPGESFDPGRHLQLLRDDDVLLRLCNNVLGRTREKDPQRFRRTLGHMLLFAPRAGFLWYERARLEDRDGLKAAAAASAEKAVALDPQAAWREAAIAIAQAARRSLN
jgi:regulator of sirC expression with transglutaminase-like and TPR domain